MLKISMRQSTKNMRGLRNAVLKHILALLSLHKSVFRKRYVMNKPRICQNLCYGVAIFYNIWYNKENITNLQRKRYIANQRKIGTENMV